MRRKTKPEVVRTELLPPDRTLSEADFKRMVAQAVEQRVSEALSHGSDSIFQPFCQPREISNEISRRQTVTEQNKWTYFFEDWGCLICGTKNETHYGLGMCKTCCNRTHRRLTASLRKHSPAPDHAGLTFMDTVRMAREAIAPAVKVLAANNEKRKTRKA